MASPYAVRILGDPVLRQRASEVTEIDGRLAALCQVMYRTMYEAQGAGLAAPQVGIQKRFMVYDLGAGDGPQVLINPVITESGGECEFNEGCLSVPGLRFDILRPSNVNVTGLNLEGAEVEFEADEFLARLMQHELDHLNGVLLIDHLDDNQRKVAKKALRLLAMNGSSAIEDSDPDSERNSKLKFGLFRSR
ncbi:MAG: peptide deformylase [Microthrixaceae bacterium]